MEVKYRTWYKIQGISCISYAVFMILLYWMIIADLSYPFIISMAVLATVSLITTIGSGLVRAFIGHKLGLKSTKKDWVLVGIALIIVLIYFIIKGI